MLKAKRLLAPLLVFITVWIIHYIWIIYFPEIDETQLQWAPVGHSTAIELFKGYIASKSYFLSYTYALSFAFAYFNYRNYQEKKACSPGKIPLISSIGITSILSVSGCFLIGCCGSPMLAVYLTWFGAGFVPIAKPLIAILSTLMIFGMYFISIRKNSRILSNNQDTNCNCNCNCN